MVCFAALVICPFLYWADYGKDLGLREAIICASKTVMIGLLRGRWSLLQRQPCSRAWQGRGALLRAPRQVSRHRARSGMNRRQLYWASIDLAYRSYPKVLSVLCALV